MNRRTKIICTLGPATDTAAQLAELVDAGMDVARLNFSHGTRDDHLARYRMVRRIAAERGRTVGVLADVVFGSRNGLPGATDSLRVLHIHGDDSATTQQPARRVVAAR